jgi:hypothetical protein
MKVGKSRVIDYLREAIGIFTVCLRATLLKETQSKIRIDAEVSSVGTKTKSRNIQAAVRWQFAEARKVRVIFQLCQNRRICHTEIVRWRSARIINVPSDVADVEINIGSQSLVMTKVNLWDRYNCQATVRIVSTKREEFSRLLHTRKYGV